MLAIACLGPSIAAAGKTIHVVFSNHFVSPHRRYVFILAP
jgi:hypothetical protein